MKHLFAVAASAVALCACSTTATGPTTAWGKEGVSMLDYRTDGALCAIRGAQANTNQNGAHTAGGINGSNGVARTGGAADAATTGGAAGSTSGPPTMGGSTYRDSPSEDFVQRAAAQQRAREIAEQRARVEVQRACLVEHGYREFPLTAEQRKHLATLPAGSNERFEYLHKLGTDPEILKTAAQPAKPGS